MRRSIPLLCSVLVTACVGQPPPPPSDDGGEAPFPPGSATGSVTLDDSAGTTEGTEIVCGDGVVQGDEECDGDDFGGLTCDDLGPEGATSSGGTLACSIACTIVASACTYCGDGVQEGAEPCDGPDLGGATCSSVDPSFDGGTLGCSAGCTMDTSACTECGDGFLEGDEECDGPVEGLTCATLAPPGTIPSGGMLQCSAACIIDASSCTYCGDGVREDTELCDGTDLDGEDCESLSNEFGGGDLECSSDCMSFETDGCCLDLGESCSSDSECCSGDCELSKICD